MQNFILYALTVLIWGSTWFVIKFQIDSDVHPLLSISYRFAIASAVLFAFMLATGKLKTAKFSLREHSYLAILGLFLFCLNYWLFYQGTFFLTTGLVAVIFSSMSLLNALNQRLFFKIPLNPKVILGAIIGLTGICLVFWPEVNTLSLKDEKLWGIGLCLLASYSASLGNMVSLRNTRASIPVIAANSYGMTYGAILSFIIALASGATVNFDTSFDYMWSLLYLAILGSAVAFCCFLTLIARIGADKAAYSTILFPIVALLISTLYEDYTWTAFAMIGLLLSVFGNIVAMTNRPSLLHLKKRRAENLTRKEYDAKVPAPKPIKD